MVLIKLQGQLVPLTQLRKWTIADRCDGTLTHDITDSVVVSDFVQHRTVVLHAGQSYLAKKP